MNFESLVGRINLIQDALQAQAAPAVNLSSTARNSTYMLLCLQKTCWFEVSLIRMFLTAIFQMHRNQYHLIWQACLPNLTHQIEFAKSGGCRPPKVKPKLLQLMRFCGCRPQKWLIGPQLPSEDDIRKYMLENITEEQFKEMMEEEK